MHVFLLTYPCFSITIQFNYTVLNSTHEKIWLLNFESVRGNHPSPSHFSLLYFSWLSKNLFFVSRHPRFGTPAWAHQWWSYSIPVSGKSHGLPSPSLPTTWTCTTRPSSYFAMKDQETGRRKGWSCTAETNWQVFCSLRRFWRSDPAKTKMIRHFPTGWRSDTS